MTTEVRDRAAVLAEALPSIRKYAGKIVLIKIGGEILEQPAICASLIADLISLKQAGVLVVLCHGGGPQISAGMKQAGKQPVFIDGNRVTDRETLDITAMVILGKINARLTAAINVHGAYGVGLSGIDAQLYSVEPEDARLGLVGRIVQVNVRLIQTLLRDGFVPVVAPLGVDAAGSIYNINADVAAGELARALCVERFLVLTNVAGLYGSFGQEDTLISQTTAGKLRELLQTKAVSEGMIPKLRGILTALDGGVPAAHMLDGRRSGELLLESFSGAVTGTLIMGDGSHER